MSRRTTVRLPAVAMLSVAALLTAGCGFITGSGGDGDGETTASDCGEAALRLATIRADSDPTTLAAEDFAERVAEATDGQVTVQVFPNSELGGINDLFAAMSSGQNVDMFYEGISIYNTLEGASAFTVMSVPFLWDSYEQMIDVLESERFQALLDEAAESTGVRVIAVAGDAEPRALSANRPVPTAADMEGLQIRIAEAPMPQAFARALGAEPQVIAFADLYLALRQGVVDAQENGAITMVNQSLYEVQDYYMPTNYIRDARTWYISDQVWGSLCQEHQDAMTQASMAAGELATAEVAEQMAEAQATLAAEIEVVEPDIESFRTALEGTFEEFDGELWPEGLLAEIEELKSAS
jgi:tripartite ATP-independent transporter DctP family solute receptor